MKISTRKEHWAPKARVTIKKFGRQSPIYSLLYVVTGIKVVNKGRLYSFILKITVHFQFYLALFMHLSFFLYEERCLSLSTSLCSSYEEHGKPRMEVYIFFLEINIISNIGYPISKIQYLMDLDPSTSFQLSAAVDVRRKFGQPE